MKKKEYRQVNGRKIPLTEDEMKQRKKDADDLLIKEKEAKKRMRIKENLYEKIKNKLSLTNDEMAIFTGDLNNLANSRSHSSKRGKQK